MDKKGFVKTFPKEDPYKMAKLHEVLERARNGGYSFHTDEFYPPSVWQVVSEMKAFKDVSPLGEDFFERKVLAVNWDGYCPLIILEIKPINSGDADLTHRDYLGGVMALGILREKFGDIFIREGSAYVVALEDMGKIVRSGLSQIGRHTVTVTRYDYEEKAAFLQPKMTSNEAVVASLRLDAVAAELIRTSRSKALDAIQRGLVLVNYHDARDKAMEIREGDIVTIRKKGKFRIGTIRGTTHKGNLRISYEQFE